MSDSQGGREAVCYLKADGGEHDEALSCGGCQRHVCRRCVGSHSREWLCPRCADSPATSPDSEPKHPGGAAGEGEDAVEAIHRIAIEAELDDLDQTTLAEWALLLSALEAGGWKLVHATSQDSSGLEEVKAERDKAVQRQEAAEQWYAVRIERLRDLARDRSKAGEPGSEMAQVWPDIASIVANGTLGPPDHPYEPPTYAQQLNVAKHRANKAEAELAKATDLAEKAANLGIARTLQRDEAWAALGELAEEFIQLSREDSALRATWAKAASLARKKAAELKEGER